MEKPRQRQESWTAERQEGNKAGRQKGSKAGRQKGSKAGRQKGRWTSIVALALLGAGVTLLAQQAPPPTPLQRLESSILRTTRSVNATWGIYVKSLETGEEIAVDADRQMETMSTIKIPLMVEALEQIKAGKFKLTDKYTFVQADSQPGTGTIQRLDPGAVMTVKDLITMMIIVSDNTATEVLYRMVGGPDAVNARMTALGLQKTRAMNVPSKWFPVLRAATTTEQFYRDGKYPFGFSTPREMGRLLEMMERGTLVDKASSDLMLRIMRGQLYRTRIPRYVTGYTIPHKTGDFLPYVGDDVGMLEAPGKTIVLTIFTGNHFGSGEMLENGIGLVAKDVADYFAYRP
jgi:beta-lactamase class A